MDLKELQSKIDKERHIIIKYDARGNPFVSMPVGNIPLKQFEEFQAVCDSEFNGNRWLFVWTLFMRSKHFDLETEVEYLKQEIASPDTEDDATDNTNPLGLLNPDA